MTARLRLAAVAVAVAVLEESLDAEQERVADGLGIGQAAGGHGTVAQHDEVPGGRFRVGAISTVAGASFVLQAGGENTSFTNIAGYAALGGVFFLVSAIRLHRRATAAR
ncbi:MAG TPA: hypothetical protein VGN37_20830 [Actinocatenispora sp.]